MNQKTKEFREQVAKQFIEALKEDGLEWKKGWFSLSMCPENAISGNPYKGINNFYLRMVSVSMGLQDVRFCTYKQAQDNGWHIKKGAHGFKIEYWMPYDYKNQKALSWKEFKLLPRKDKEKIGLRAKYYTVFNAKDIEGIPELEKPELREITPDKIIEKLSKNMNVEIINDGGYRAFYRPSEDKIHLPLPQNFDNDYAYNSTALHELAHATGAASRLNRNLQNIFGSPEYAFEELIAEVSSCFMSVNLSTLQPGNELENHAAYVNSWIEAIEKSPEVLMKAIKEAERTANYMEYKAELINELEYTNTLESSITVDERVVETPTQELNDVKINLAKAMGYNGVVLDPETEYKRYNILEEQCVPFRDYIGTPEIEADLSINGYIPTKKLVCNIKKFSEQMGRDCSLQDIHELYKSKQPLPEEAKEILENIVNECQCQELQQLELQPEPCD